MAVTIRPMRPADYDAVAAVWAAAGLPARHTGRDAREPLLKQLEAYPTTYLVAEEDGRIVGVVLGTHDHRKGWINRLAVQPDRQRQGIARRLLAACEAALHACGMEIISAMAEDGNEASVKLFESAGYENYGPITYFRKLKRPDI
jgi:ribosomal protein S18 acetylase RimI-like enzyme